jgi:hypothetical protein
MAMGIVIAIPQPENFDPMVFIGAAFAAQH